MDTSKFLTGNAELWSYWDQVALGLVARGVDHAVSAGKSPEPTSTGPLLMQRYSYHVPAHEDRDDLTELILVESSVNLWQNLREGLREISWQSARAGDTELEITIFVDWADLTRTKLWLRFFLRRRVFRKDRRKIKIEVVGIKFYPNKWRLARSVSTIEGMLGVLIPRYHRMLDKAGQDYHSPVHAAFNTIAKRIFGHEV